MLMIDLVDLIFLIQSPQKLNRIIKKKSFTQLLFLSFLLISFCCFGQEGIGTIGNLIKKEKNTFFIPGDQADVQLQFCTPEMVRIRTSWNKSFEEDENLMVIKYNWPEVNVDVKEDASHIFLQTSKIKVQITKNPFGIEIANEKGEVLSSESIPSGGAYKKGNRVGNRKKLSPDEHFFGFGERMDFVDQRGKELKLDVGRGTGQPHIVGAYNILEANYCPVPFFMSTKGYGIYLHNPYATRWDLGKNNPESYSFMADGGELDYYFIYGPDFPSILNQYTSVTGRAPLLPRFAHGLHVGTYSGGTWGYEHLTSTQYVVELVRKYRAMGIPIDILHLDSTWRIFGENGGKGATSFEWRETFDDPKSMFDSLYAMHINMAGVHVRPRFDNGKKLRLLDQAREKGLVYPEEDNPGEFVNFFDEEAVDWWWENGVKEVAKLGVKFLKTDEGSAFGRLANESEKVGPTDSAAQRLHNVFPVAYAKAPFEKFAKHNGIRGMNHTREGYAGIQRYPFIWAGDWPSEWQYFAPVIKAGLNIGLSGVGYWTHNMGGFEHDADPELFIRWVQFGMFSPLAHVFGMDHPGYKEPWNYGEEALKNFTKYDRLRYQLIPYIYSNAYKMHQTGLPIMRALVLEYQDDQNTYLIDDQYLFGNSMMVCPVITKGAQTRVVYLPKGTWFEYWTGKKFTGEEYYNIVTPLDQLPIFIKGGAIIPWQEEIQYDDKEPWGKITFEVFPSESSKFELYEDDGLSESYKDGNFAKTPISSDILPQGYEIKIGKALGNFKVPGRLYDLKIHQDKAPSKIELTLNGKKKKIAQLEGELKQKDDKEGWYYDAENKLLWIRTAKTAAEEKAFKIAF